MSLGIFLKVTPRARQSPVAPASPIRRRRGPTRMRSLALLADQSQHACRDGRGMPIHSHHGAKRLEPEPMREPPQTFVSTLFVHRHFAARNEIGTRIMPA